MFVYAFYILKVVICSAILFGYYWLMLRNKIFHQYNRFYLLAAIVLSLTLPLISIDVWLNANEATPAIKLLQAVNSSNEYLDEIVVSAQSKTFSSEQVVTAIYFLTSLLFLGAFVWALIRIRILFTRHRHRLLGNIFFVNTTAKGTPFSFLQCIFWNDHIDPETTTGKQVFKHELAHVQQKHSYDKLLLNAVLVVAWCNPFFWLIRKELNMIHEFVADKIAVEDSDTEAFAAMILQAAYPQHRFQLSNPFFYSPIKRRLMMLTKNRNPKVGYIGRLMVLPLSILIFAAFSFKTKTVRDAATYDGPAITVVIDAGHGGKDAGASSAKGNIFEKDLSLEISKKIKALNTNKKINVVLSRESDVYQTPGEKLAFGIRSNADLFISVHLNPLKSGIDVLVPAEDNLQKKLSDLLASALINEFKTGLHLPVSDQPKQPGENVKVLEGTSFPAVLIEAGNISNMKDLSYLKTGGGLEAIARKILEAVEIFSASRKFVKQEQPVLTATTIAPPKPVVAKDTVPNTTLKTSEKALILVDGKVTTNVELNKIAPETITRVNVLKNQEAIKLYGEEGKNGVILVETRPPHLLVNNVNVRIESDSTKIENIKLDNVKISYTKEVLLQKQPLYVVNEVVLSKPVNIELIQPNDIQSINIIKDKVAIAKYGPSAINGVIEITTRDKQPVQEIPAKTNKISSRSDEVDVVGYGSKQNINESPNEKVFTVAETEPKFPGGDSAWRKYLVQHLKADVPVNEGWKAGVYKIVVSFIVRKDGTIADIRTNDYPGTKTAEHCIELIRQGPKWTPAQQNGQTVNAYKKQPITFVVTDKTSL